MTEPGIEFLGLRVSIETKRRLEQIAKKRQTTLSVVTRQALEHYCKYCSTTPEEKISPSDLRRLSEEFNALIANFKLTKSA